MTGDTLECYGNKEDIAAEYGLGRYFGGPKTNRSRRTIPIPATLTQSIRDHRRKQSEEMLKAGPKCQNNFLVFATAEGSPLIPRNLLSRHFKPILKRAGLPDSIRLYDLRHSCTTQLLVAGENSKVVSERLGHAGIAMFTLTYCPRCSKARQRGLRECFSLNLTHQKEKSNLAAALS